MKLTRRELAAAVSATAVAAQTEPRAANPVDQLQIARDRIKANGDLLAQQRIPMATEPAFQFKA
jgi:hypothetical protein